MPIFGEVFIVLLAATVMQASRDTENMLYAVADGSDRYVYQWGDDRGEREFANVKVVGNDRARRQVRYSTGLVGSLGVI